MKGILLVSILLLFSHASMGSTRGDQNYLVGKIGERTSVYFTHDDTSFAESINNDLKLILPFYEKSFQHVLDEKLHLVIKSSQNHQIMNAFSTQYPHNLATYYAGGVLDPDYFAAKSWIDLLSAHEVAHNFQMNVKDNWISKTTSSIFGNTPFVFLGIIPLFSHPNFFIPQFIVEGNAVLNESLYDNGGRLYNGEHLAIALSYIRAGRFTPKNMINKKLVFPYGLKPYVIGAYFQLYLAQEYGLDRVNRFFKINSTKAFAVFSLDDSFYQTYGKGYQQLFNEFVESYNGWSNPRKELRGKSVAQSQFSYLMDRDRNFIYFYTQTDNGSPLLKKLNVSNNKVSEVDGSWFEGRPIVVGKDLYTSSNQYLSYNKNSIALFNSDQEVLKESIDRSIQDFKNGHLLYFDVKKSYGEGALYLDNHFISYAHSSAILDDDLNVYYFKNRGKERTLYRNQTPLFTYEGHWGYPVDVVGESIYFIAPTKYGATLYQFIRGHIYRAHSADNIVDAKWVKNSTFFVRSVDDQGYYYKLTELNSVENRPYQIAFKVSDQSTFSLDGKSTLEHIESYNSLTGMRYDGLWFNTTISSAGRDGVTSDDVVWASFTFSDPMEFYYASLGLYASKHLQFARGSYFNQRYRFAYGLDVTHVFEDSRVRYNQYTDFPVGLGGEFYFDYPWWVSGKKRLTTTGSGYIDYEDVRKNPLLLGLEYSYAITYGISKYPQTLFKIGSFAKFDKGGYSDADSKDLYMLGGDFSLGKTLFSGFYVQLSGKYVSSNQGNGIRVDNYSFYSHDQTNFVVPGLDFAYYAKQVGSASLYIAKNFNLGFYHRWIPIGLRREALFIKATSLQFEYDGGASLVSLYPENSDSFSWWSHESMTSIQMGVEFEVLLGHLLPMNMSLYYLRNNRSLGDHEVVFNLGGSF